MTTAAQRIMDLFAGYEGQHGTHGVPDLDPNGVKWGIKRTAKTIKRPVTLAMWQDHLEGKRPLGIPPIRKDSTCIWGSIDIDQYDIDLADIVRKVEELKLPLVPCRSKSGGLHLFMFFAEPVDAAAAQGVLRDLAASLGFAGCEIFPKQTKVIEERGDKPNWIVMPYYGDDYGGKLRMQYGLKKTGAEMTVGEFLTMAEKRRVTPDKMIELASQTKHDAPAKGKKGAAAGNEGGKRPKSPYGDGPPCLQHLAASGFPEGGRNNALFHIGVYLKKAHPSDWQKHLEHDNQMFMKPPLPAEEVDAVTKSLVRKEYEYKCKDQPMVSHCNSVVCRGRKHGVGVGGSYPEILGLDKLDTEPPVWFVQISGGHRIPMMTEDLQNYTRFHKKCMDVANVCYKMIPVPVWFSILGEAMQKVETIDAPDDIGLAGVFLEMLETFLTNRMRGKQKEDLLRGAPWEDEEAGRHYFTLASLEKFLQREGVRDVTRSTLKYRIEAIKGAHTTKQIKGHHRSVWWVPSEVINPAPVLDAPEPPKEHL